MQLWLIYEDEVFQQVVQVGGQAFKWCPTRSETPKKKVEEAGGCEAEEKACGGFDITDSGRPLLKACSVLAPRVPLKLSVYS